ncbi:hypothetical protein, partial [Picosynechococcus sp. PCC 7002]|uniref:hypothetical protein n=1 Tax=Picosynechococcus sp. (strain ATCC 27264 / PCC 7002 / PR-6) TaxID=32049 RepID=UPI001C3D2048
YVSRTPVRELPPTSARPCVTAVTYASANLVVHAHQLPHTPPTPTYARPTPHAPCHPPTPSCCLCCMPTANLGVGEHFLA